jgi:hypothetical protein
LKLDEATLCDAIDLADFAIRTVFRLPMRWHLT